MPGDRRGAPARALALARQAFHLMLLPRGAARVYVRALRTARREHDGWSLAVATRPRELRVILAAARGRRRAVEVGTGTGWTTLMLAAGDSRRRVLSLDPVERPAREIYLGLAGADVRGRIELRRTGGEAPPLAGDGGVVFLFIDGAHGRAETVAAFGAWRRALADDALVVFHDYGDPAYPGVAEAVAELGLRGEVRGRCLVWRLERDR